MEESKRKGAAENTKTYTRVCVCVCGENFVLKGKTFRTKISGDAQLLAIVNVKRLAKPLYATLIIRLANELGLTA